MYRSPDPPKNGVIAPLMRLFDLYNINSNEIELEKITVYHPRVGRGISFEEALGEDMPIITTIINNTLSSVGCPV